MPGPESSAVQQNKRVDCVFVCVCVWFVEVNEVKSVDSSSAVCLSEYAVDVLRDNNSEAMTHAPMCLH